MLEIEAGFILHPRSLTVLTGTAYSIECVGVQTSGSERTNITFHAIGFQLPAVVTYMYPTSPGFPVYRVGVASREEPSCYFCIMSPDPYVYNHARFSRKSFITVHGEFLIVWIDFYVVCASYQVSVLIGFSSFMVS